jgi:K+-transporting ATPase ATPase C chain
MKIHFLVSAKVLALCLALLGIVYPLIIYLAGQAIFPFQANGSLIRQGTRVIGSTLIAQEFSLPGYFEPRPSASAYDAGSSGGSNLAPTSSRLVEFYRNRIKLLQVENSASHSKIPLELVAVSASGLDPHLSLGAALWQVPRVASARNLAREELDKLIMVNARPPLLGFIGEWRVNVLELNLELDEFTTRREDR